MYPFTRSHAKHRATKSVAVAEPARLSPAAQQRQKQYEDVDVAIVMESTYPSSRAGSRRSSTTSSRGTPT
ncbi:hypothetical protein [Kocuria sp.]|uniref:hypothetical protein n=1 Tax=Kocuria sp. TaxID=1871328 RepID=UPI0028977AFD|nr:hypothetical protein [Kocuria sp.]